MERDNHIMLFDFYGSLLTKRQTYIFNLHYMEDYSLAEIGHELGITPQAVHDMLKRSVRSLEKYEHKLGLVQKFFNNKQTLERINNESDIDIIRNIIKEEIYGI